MRREPRSYRDLPLRLAEYGTCYRYEQSGELFGLMRVRSLNMNDAHIYCTEEQFADEFNAVNEMYLKYFKIFGIDKYVMRFSTHDPAKLGQKFVNEPELWKKTEDMVRKVLIESEINYHRSARTKPPSTARKSTSRSGASSAANSRWPPTRSISPCPSKFGLTYRDRDNTEKTPLCIHRAPLGTHERFIGFLIEHYAGNFPLWLAPEQVRVLTIGDDETLVELCQRHRPGTPRQHGPRRRRLRHRQNQRQNPARREVPKSTPCWWSGARHGSRTQSASASTAKAISAPSPGPKSVADMLAAIRERRPN